MRVCRAFPTGGRTALAHSLWRLVCPLGVRVAAAQSEDPLVDEGVVEEEEDADVEVEEEEVGVGVPAGGAVRCGVAL